MPRIKLIKKFLNPGHYSLAFLLCALILPSIAVVFVAFAGMINQETAMEAAVSSYVQDLAENIAYQLNADFSPYKILGESGGFHSAENYPFFAWGPSMPGWIALIGVDGKIIAASPGAVNIAAIWRPDIPAGRAVRVEDKLGAQYTLAVYPIASSNHGGYKGGYVVAAVSWNQLLGGLVKVTRMWPVLIVLMAFGSFLAIRLLWSRLVFPLHAMATEIDDLIIGHDVPKVPPDDFHEVKEIKSVHKALRRFAQAAVERDNLRNSYVRDIVNVQEKERVDMAREIHDGPLQDVTALLQQIHMSLDDEDSRPRIQRTEKLAKTIVRELRALCDELAPPWMDLGLTETLTELAERLSQSYDIEVTAELENDFDTEPELRLSFLRIFQEAVSNAVRHGHATEVTARVYKNKNNNDKNNDDNENLILEIQDNGTGFNAEMANLSHEELRVKGHRGLANMTERMSLMNGSLRVISEPENGTKIIAEVPLKHD